MARPLTRGLRTAAVATSAAATILLTGGAPAFAATSVVGTVETGGDALNVRSYATTAAPIVATIPNGGTVTLLCQMTGQTVQGRGRTSNLWNRTSDGRWVTDVYVRHAAIAPCTIPLPPITSAPAASAPVAASGWTIPVPNKPGQRFRPASNPSHDGVDIMEPRNTPIRAASAGKVVTVTCNTSGPSCDVDGSPSVRGCGWYVEVKHAGDVTTRYCHMVRKPEVVVGQTVKAGQVIGYVGTSGNSSGTHLHFEVHRGTGYASHANAVDPVAFMQSVGAPLGGVR
jgi:murein DD-endopeptidase MepM/ murein hydrolase activator NlpD